MIILNKQDIQELFGSKTDYLEIREIEHELEMWYLKMTGDIWEATYVSNDETFQLRPIINL